VNLRPLGDRILVKPEPQASMTDSGLHLVEHAKPDEMGTVVAVGFARHPLKDDAENVAEWLETEAIEAGHDSYFARGAELLRNLVRKEPSVKVGDTVLFSWASGQELTLNDGAERYILLKESDLLAVLEE